MPRLAFAQSFWDGYDTLEKARSHSPVKSPHARWNRCSTTPICSGNAVCSSSPALARAKR